MPFDDLAGDGEPESGAASALAIAGRLGAVEGKEDLFDVARCDPGSVVATVAVAAVYMSAVTR